MCKIHGLRVRKVTFRLCENDTKIDSVLIRIQHRWIIENVKVILGEFQHLLVVADIDKRKTRNVVRKACVERRMVCLLKHE